MMETRGACPSSSDVHPISDRSVVENASEGVLLRGITVLGNLEKIYLKGKVLKLRSDVQLQMPWKMAYEYAHASQINPFETLNEINSLGFSATISIKPKRRITTKKKSIADANSDDNKLVFYSFQPTHSWEGRTEDFCLDEHVVEELKTISMNINENMEETEIRCLEFVKKYGTHVLIGGVHFGRAAATAESISLPQLQGPSVRCVCSCSEYTPFKSKTGFSMDSENKKSLQVIDRDISKVDNFVPIWKFILNENTINGNKELAELIRYRCDDSLSTICFASLEKEIVHFSMCTLYSVLCFEMNEETYAAVLRQFSHEISNVENSVWQVISTKCELIAKLLRTVKANTSSEQDELDVKLLFETILRKSKEIDFPSKKDIIDWLRRFDKKDIPKHPEVVVESREQLMEAINSGKILSAAKTISKSDSDLDHCITTVLSKTIAVLFDKLKTNNTDDFEYLFLLSCLIPFDMNFGADNTFRTIMSIPRLQSLYDKLCSNNSNFSTVCDRSPQIHHAWVTHLLIKEIIDSQPQASLTFSALPVEFQTNTVRLHKCIKQHISKKGKLNDILRELLKIMDDERNEILTWRYQHDKVQCSTTFQDACSAEHVSFQPLQSILHRLKLTDVFPEKITLEIATEITEKTFSFPSSTPDIPWIMLKKIMSCDFLFRETSVIESMSAPLHTEKDIMDSDSDGDGDDEDKKIEQKIETEAIHPLDAFYALFICCDLFLKGVICRKLSEMQIAIPFSYPHTEDTSTLSLWPMRHIYCGDNPHSMATTPFKIVTFMRVGKNCFKSKSKLINEMLRDQNEEHGTFFHRDCQLGTKSREVYNGVIEVAWHILSLDKCGSSEKDSSDQIADELLILNLRGDSMIHRKQVDHILHVSHILVVLLEYTMMTDDNCISFMSTLHDRDINILIITNNPRSKNESELRSEMKKYKERAKVEKTKTKTILIFDCKTKRQKNTVEVRDELIHAMEQMLRKSTQKKTPEECAHEISRFPGTRIDEDNTNCKYGKRLAVELFTQMTKQFPNVSMKTAILPLQGKEMWQKWSGEQKVLNAYGHAQNAVEKITLAMEKIRKKQVDLCNSSDFLTMGIFTKNVLSLKNEKEKLLFFLSWFEKFLDQRSRFILPEFIAKLTEVYNLSKSGMQNQNTGGRGEPFKCIVRH